MILVTESGENVSDFPEIWNRESVKPRHTVLYCYYSSILGFESCMCRCKVLTQRVCIAFAGFTRSTLMQYAMMQRTGNPYLKTIRSLESMQKVDQQCTLNSHPGNRKMQSAAKNIELQARSRVFFKTFQKIHSSIL